MEDTSPEDLEHWINQLRVLERTNSCRAPLFIKPFHLVTVAHMLRQKKASNLRLPDKLCSYANTMNLWGVLNMTPPGNIEYRQPHGRYHPIEFLVDRSSLDDLSDHLVELFARGNVDSETLKAIGTMLRELIDNCYSHANVEDGVYGAICAQVWGGGGKAQIAIADNGIGIRSSLAQNPLLLERLVMENGCKLATEYEVSSKLGRGHSGYGLTVVRKLLEQNKGTLFVRSLDECFLVTRGTCKIFHLLPQWHGTLLIIEWDLKNKMNIGDVYSMLPLPEGMTDEDFNL
jgi:anti-sigma regulatory factor (Ser/Thr protein kinase)